MKNKFNNSSNLITGISGAPGISVSKAYLYSKEKLDIFDGAIEDTDEAVKNLNDALERSKHELNKILSYANEKMGEKRAAIFEAQIMILDDPYLLESITKGIVEEKKLPEFIVNREISKYTDLMNSSDEYYLKERSHDIDDIKNRIIRNLKKKRLKSKLPENSIIVTANLTPADTILFSKSNVKGFLTDFGGLTSHAAIVARSLKIPAVLGTHDATKRVKDDDVLIIDGFNGIAILNPAEDQLDYYNQKLEKLNQYDKELLNLRDKPAVTTDKKEIILRSNIDVPEELEVLIQSGSKGIGLLRTEQVFGEMETFPDEEEQFRMYSELASKIYPEYIIIRAFDVGGDKFLPYDIKEPNPFLGWRGIRFLLDNVEIFETQIRAVLRASILKNVKFMLPMVSSIHEVRLTKHLIHNCKEELKKAKKKFDNHIKIGVMVEVPSVAVMAKEFAGEVDFLSIGTNDLIQFLLAVDRGNENVSLQYQEFHPSVIKTISHIIKSAKQSNALVSMCGEMAANTFAIPLLVGMGLDSLSTSPAAIPYIKKIIRSMSYEKARILADECLNCVGIEEITQKINKFFKDNQIERTQNIF